MKNKTNATFSIDKNTWNLFKKLCKINDTDASKELRRFIRQYIEENKDKANKLF